MNTRGSSSFLNYYNIVISSIGGITIANLELIFYILAFNNGI